MNKNIILIILTIVIILIGGCIQQQNRVSEKGFLEGKVTIGPLCPVERYPPDPSCQPTEETYKAYPIAVYTPDKKTKLAQIEPLMNGIYKVELAVGGYIVDLEKQHMFGKNLPATITIKKGEITTLNIDIDTGIR
jgi:hypothetical protein